MAIGLLAGMYKFQGAAAGAKQELKEQRKLPSTLTSATGYTA